MNRRPFAILTALMWIALPLTALRYAQVWNELPTRMATHFNAAGQPNGWMPRDSSLHFGLGLVAFVLVVFTVIALVIRSQQTMPDAASYALLGFFYLIIGFIVYGNESVIQYNVAGRPIVIAPMLIGVPLALVVFTFIYLRGHRGQALPEAQTIAEESHGSKPLGVFFLLLAGIEFAVAFSVPAMGVRIGMGLLGTLFLLIAAFAWSGFRYRFTPAGLEISTLGLRLRSIRQAQIAHYRPEKWMALRGYGIRGVGNTRAYVWGNQVVHITTLEGEVFLGTNDPTRIMRDLDAVKQYAHS